MSHVTALVIGLLAASAQAYVPSAPIQWMSRVVMPKIPAGSFRGSTAPQQLLIKDPPSKMSRDNVPYFTLNSDSSISLEGTKSCIEAASAKRGDAIRLNRCTGEPTQKWTWIPDSHGGSRIRLKDTDNCLAASIDGGFNGSPMLWECESKGAESWKFEEPVLFHKQGRYMVMNLLTLAGIVGLSLGALVWQYMGPQKSAQRSGSVNPSLDMSVIAATEDDGIEKVDERISMSMQPCFAKRSGNIMNVSDLNSLQMSRQHCVGLDGALEPHHLVADATPHCRGALGSGVRASDVVCVANPSAPEGSAVSARRRVILIGIGGSSGSGKTTLASSLAKELASPVKVFSADHYLDLKRVQRVGSWDTPAGIAWDEMRLALERVMETLAQATCLPQHLVIGDSPPAHGPVDKQFPLGPLDLIPRGQGAKPLGSDTVVVLVEGFLLFHDKKTCDMLDVAIWVETECDICAIRRWKREGQQGSPGGYCDQFRQEVWRHYELYRDEQLANVPRVLQLDAALEPSDLVKEAERHCRSAIDAVVDDKFSNGIVEI